MLTREICGQGELSQVAGEVACSLCKYQKCVTRFREKRVQAFYLRVRSHPDYGNQAETFLALAGAFPDEDDKNYYSAVGSYSSSSG
jgi:hypothetical protein